jgi:DnaK suppressor protein
VTHLAKHRDYNPRRLKIFPCEGYNRRRKEIAVSKTPAKTTLTEENIVDKPISVKKAVDKKSTTTTDKAVVAKRAAATPAPEASSTPGMTPAPTPQSAASLKKAARIAAKYGGPAVPTPLPPPTSRFADRFAPPRPPTRQMGNMEPEIPKQVQKFDPKLVNAWKTKAGRDLTDAEVLAMPESEYMNDKQLEFFRTKLQRMKDDLLNNASETTEHLREDTSIVPDPADRATIEEEHQLELRTRDRERKLLIKISQSFGRIESGEYGFCDETGEHIGVGRLIARPTATLSIEAQERSEVRRKMYLD